MKGILKKQKQKQKPWACPILLVHNEETIFFLFFCCQVLHFVRCDRTQHEPYLQKIIILEVISDYVGVYVIHTYTKIKKSVFSLLLFFLEMFSW